MKIAILTSGILPVPAVQGGAVENLIDFYLDYNNRHKLHDITIYSTYDEKTASHPALQSDVNHYKYIKTNSLTARIRKRISRFFQKQNRYYDFHIEYFIREAIKEIRKKHFDLIIMENRPAFSLHFKNGERIAYHLHNDNLNINIRKAEDIYNAAETIICVSDYITDRVRTINKNDIKTRTVYNGIDIARFSKVNSSVTKASLGLKNNDFVIAFIGRIIPDKGIKQLIEAMLLLTDYSDIKLLVIGSSFLGSNSGNSSFHNSLNELSKPIESNIIFTGYVNYDKIPEYLYFADIATVPSVWEEPFGLTCIESLAAGLPLITTYKGGIPEVVDEKSAILLNADNSLPQSLADAILNLYNNKEQRKKMSKEARLHASHFDKDEYSKNFFKAIEP